MPVTESNVRAPDDSANTGKRVRTRTRLVGADTVHEHVIQLAYPEIISGMYDAHSGVYAVQASAHGSTDGYLRLMNPVSSGYNIVLRKVKFQSTAPSAAARQTSPRVTMERFTFTGAHSGSTITPSKRKTSYQSAQARVSDNATGITPSAGEIIRGFFVIPVMSAVGPGFVHDLEWIPNTEEGEIVIAPGEGIIFRQADAGTSGDDRLVLTDITWLEYATA